jgi:hypothetical protein
MKGRGRAARNEFDSVHSHLDFVGFPCAALVDTPTMTTLHGRLDLPGSVAEQRAYPPLRVGSRRDRGGEPTSSIARGSRRTQVDGAMSQVCLYVPKS